MTAKEKFLRNLLHQIQTLQAAYEVNKNLPDSVFDGVLISPSTNQHNIAVSKPIDKPTANVLRMPIKAENSQQSEYGLNKRTMIAILQKEGKAMMKYNILENFSEMLGKSTADILNTVTNTISTLKEDGTIIGYKPAGLRLKGQFWGLSEWFVNGFIKEQYSPFKNVTIL